MTIREHARKMSLVGILTAGALVSCTNQKKTEYERNIEELRRAFPSSIIHDPNKPGEMFNLYIILPKDDLEKHKLKDYAIIYQSQKEETDGTYMRYVYGEIKTDRGIIKLVEKEIFNR